VLADVNRVDPDAVGKDGLLDGVADDDVTVEGLTELVNRGESPNSNSGTSIGAPIVGRRRVAQLLL
jgi:hypothetical protein